MLSGEIPISKSQIPMKYQGPNLNFQWKGNAILGRLPHWRLDIGYWDFIGIWDLEIGISSQRPRLQSRTGPNTLWRS
jgi:hypothetical protein